VGRCHQNFCVGGNEVEQTPKPAAGSRSGTISATARGGEEVPARWDGYSGGLTNGGLPPYERRPVRRFWQFGTGSTVTVPGQPMVVMPYSQAEAGRRIC